MTTTTNTNGVTAVQAMEIAANIVKESAAMMNSIADLMKTLDPQVFVDIIFSINAEDVRGTIMALKYMPAAPIAAIEIADDVINNILNIENVTGTQIANATAYSIIEEFKELLSAMM